MITVFPRSPPSLLTCRYPTSYPHTRRWDTDLLPFTESVKLLAGTGGPFERLEAMPHLNHLQHDLDRELYRLDRLYALSALSGFYRGERFLSDNTC